MADLAKNFRSGPALARFAGTALAGLGLDLWIKWLAFAKLAPNGVGPRRSINLVPGILRIDLTANRGAVFGLGQGQRNVFIVISILAIGFLAWLFATSDKRRFYQFVLGLLLAGVLGNLYDRVTLHYVRDMLHALPGVTWPRFIQAVLPDPYARMEVFPWIFNVADSLLCIGVGLMLVLGLFGHRPDAAEKPAGDKA